MRRREAVLFGDGAFRSRTVRTFACAGSPIELSMPARDTHREWPPARRDHLEEVRASACGSAGTSAALILNADDDLLRRGPVPSERHALRVESARDQSADDDRLVVEAFDRHWRGAPRVRRIVFKPIPEPFTRAAALRNNEVDLIDTLPPNLASELERVPGIRVQRVPSTWIIYLGLNAFRKPLSDVRVRQALNYATDVDAIVKSVLDGNGRRMDGPFTPQMFGFDPSVKGYRPDVARARQLLAEAGYPDGLEITLEAPAGRYQGDKEIAEALGGQWQKAGFKPRVQVAEWGAYFKRYLGKQFQDAYLLGLGGPMQDADELYNLVSSKGRGLYYKNEKIDALFDAGRSTMDPARRKKIYADLARTMVEDATWVFLMQQVDIYATRDRVTWTPRPDQWLLLHEAALK